jgi:prophage regulatory protein
VAFAGYLKELGIMDFLSVRELPRATSTAYADVRKGLLPPPVKLGPRRSGWPAHEIQQIFAARAAGWDENNIRALVLALMKARQQQAPTLPASL